MKSQTGRSVLPSRFAVLALVALSAMIVSGCATDTMRLDEPGTTQSAPPKTSQAAPDTKEGTDNLAHLQELWNARQSDSQNEDYPIGPGDVLTISVPDVEQLSQKRVRVSTRGTIELPLIGTISTIGLSEDALATEIDNKLQKFMYNPQANVFVDEYRNREVAVIGAVNRPGLVLLNSPSESLLDVLTQCGGLGGAASNQVILIPSRPGTVSMSERLASMTGHSMRRNGQTVNDMPDSSANPEQPGEKVADAGESATSWQSGGQRQNAGFNANPYDTQRGADDSGSGSGSGQNGDSSASGDAGNSANGASGAAAPPGGLGSSSQGGQNDKQFSSGTAGRAEGPINPGRQFNGGVATASIQPEGTAAEAMELANGQALTINLKSTNLSDGGQYMNMPMRPGDVLIVPGGGDVMVVGWVHQPGRFQAGAGLTVLGAIGAAGGPMYAANTSDITLIRTAKNGSKTNINVDMNKITHGEADDIPVEANDVIDVPYSGWRIGPYIFYSVLTKMAIGGPAIPY